MKDSLKQALYGQNAHVSTETIFDGISMKQASDADFTEHSIWQLLQHITYWQQFLLRQYQDVDMPVPTHSSDTWPKERVPESETHWKNAVMTYKNGLIELETFIDEIDDNADVSDILSIILHTSYHAGQVVLIRKHLSSWPPPSGGDSW